MKCIGLVSSKVEAISNPSQKTLTPLEHHLIHPDSRSTRGEPRRVSINHPDVPELVKVAPNEFPSLRFDPKRWWRKVIFPRVVAICALSSAHLQRFAS